jgi:hypothetical protein
MNQVTENGRREWRKLKKHLHRSQSVQFWCWRTQVDLFRKKSNYIGKVRTGIDVQSWHADIPVKRENLPGVHFVLQKIRSFTTGRHDHGNGGPEQERTWEQATYGILTKQSHLRCCSDPQDLRRKNKQPQLSNSESRRWDRTVCYIVSKDRLQSCWRCLQDYISEEGINK